MKIAILDDSENMRNKIKNIVIQEYSENDVFTFSSILEYEQNQNVFDLLLLDIELQEEHGIEYIKCHPQKHCYVIYVSSHNEYMIDAFEINVMGFVPKNLIEERLLNQIHIVEKEILSKKSYVFDTLNGKIDLRESEVLYLYYSEHTVCLRMTNGEILYLTARSLREVEKMLSNDFYKINRMQIVNLKKIKQLMKDTHEVLMLGNKKLKVSDRVWSKFKNAYQASRYHYD